MLRFQGVRNFVDRLKRRFRRRNRRHSTPAAPTEIGESSSSRAAPGNGFADFSYHGNSTEEPEPLLYFPGNHRPDVETGTQSIPPKENFHEVTSVGSTHSVRFCHDGSHVTCSVTTDGFLVVEGPTVSMVVDEILKAVLNTPLPNDPDDWCVAIIQVLMDYNMTNSYGTSLASEDFSLKATFTHPLPLIDKITDSNSKQKRSSSYDPSYSDDAGSNADLCDVFAGKKVYGQLYSCDQPYVQCPLVLNDKSDKYGTLLKQKGLTAPAYHLNQVKVNGTFRTYVCSYKAIKVTDEHHTIQNVSPLAAVEWYFKGTVDRQEQGDYKVNMDSAPLAPVGYNSGQIPPFPDHALKKQNGDDGLVAANGALQLELVLPQ